MSSAFGMHLRVLRQRCPSVEDTLTQPQPDCRNDPDKGARLNRRADPGEGLAGRCGNGSGENGEEQHCSSVTPDPPNGKERINLCSEMERIRRSMLGIARIWTLC